MLCLTMCELVLPYTAVLTDAEQQGELLLRYGTGAYVAYSKAHHLLKFGTIWLGQ